MEALHNLGIDFKVFIAQVINFAIILFVLTKFLYRPIINVLENRRQKIAEGLEFAAASEKKLQETEKDYANTLETAKQEARKILDDARTDAEKERQKLLTQAEQEAEALKSSAREAMNTERRKMAQEIKSKVGTLAVLIIEKALKTDLGEGFYKKHLDKVLQEVRGA